MKRLPYRVFGWIGACMKVFPRKEKALFFMVHDCRFRGNLRYVYEECKRSYPTLERVVLSKKAMLTPRRDGFVGVAERLFRNIWFALRVNYHLATSTYVFLNDNFLPLAYLHFPRKVKLVQLWHGAGAFKRFGLITETDKMVCQLVKQGNARVDYLPVTASFLRGIYRDAMGVAEEHIYADGIPLMDFYRSEALQKKAKERVYGAFPQLRGKRCVLYAPTLRRTQEENDAIPMQFDAIRLIEAMGEDTMLLVRFHPTVQPRNIEWKHERILLATDYPDVKELLVVSDMLITDYSSVAVEYSLLNRPILFYMYDAPDRNGVAKTEGFAYDRGVYLETDKFPGGYARTMDELISACRDMEGGMANARHFYTHNFDCTEAPGYSGRMLSKLIPGDRHVGDEEKS